MGKVVLFILILILGCQSLNSQVAAQDSPQIHTSFHMEFGEELGGEADSPFDYLYFHFNIPPNHWEATKVIGNSNETYDIIEQSNESMPGICIYLLIQQ